MHLLGAGSSRRPRKMAEHRFQGGQTADIRVVHEMAMATLAIVARPPRLSIFIQTETVNWKTQKCANDTITTQIITGNWALGSVTYLGSTSKSEL